MSPGLFGVFAIGLFNLALIAVVLRRPGLIAVAGGRLLVFLAVLALPVIAFSLGLGQHVERSKRTAFCVSCHVMEPYGQSLDIDSPDHLPAQHFQNARVDKDLACFVCHTNYTMYGDLQAKMTGLKHVWVNYLGTVPDELTLYRPYQNRECLHCHAEARFFEESDLHRDIRPELESNDISCLECHDLVHDVGELATLDMWEGGR